MPIPSNTAAPPRRASLRAKLLLASGSVLATLAAVEAGLWCFHPLDRVPPKRIHRFLPSYHAMSPVPRVLDLDPGPLSGVTPGVRQLRINAHGFLYPDEKGKRRSAAEWRIAVVGGSTVECSALHEEKRWSAVLEQVLQRDVPDRPVTVLNLGLSAIDTRTHLATTCQHVTALDVDLVVFMLGANDLFRAGDGEPSLLSPDNFYKPVKASRVLAELLQATQIGRHVVLWRELRAARPRTTPYFHDEVGRQAALPPLPAPLRMGAAGLAGYARNIVSLAGICQAHGIAVVFTTQPTMVTRQPTAEERAVLWGFHTGKHNVSPENFADLLDAVNRCLTDTCAARGYACVDLAKTIPRGLGHFYDQVHFNEAGARLVAESLAPRVREVLGQRRQ